MGSAESKQNVSDDDAVSRRLMRKADFSSLIKGSDDEDELRPNIKPTPKGKKSKLSMGQSITPTEGRNSSPAPLKTAPTASTKTGLARLEELRKELKELKEKNAREVEALEAEHTRLKGRLLMVRHDADNNIDLVGLLKAVDETQAWRDYRDVVCAREALKHMRNFK